MKLSIRPTFLSVIAACFCLIFAIQIQAQNPTVFVSALTWSHGGEFIAIGYGTDEKESCYADYLYPVQVVDALLNLLQEFTSSCNVNGLAFSLDDTTLISVSRSGSRSAWDLTNNIAYPITLGFEPLLDIKLISDHTFFILSQSDIIIQNEADIRLVSRSEIHTNKITDADWSSDGLSIVTTSLDETVHVWTWETETVRTVSLFQGHEVAVTSVAWQPTENSNVIASGDIEGNIKIWNAETGVELMTITAHDGVVNELIWSPDGQTLISGGDDGFVRVWQIGDDSNIELAEFDYQAPVYAIAINPDGTQIAYGGQGIDGQNGEVVIADLDFVVTPDADY